MQFRFRWWREVLVVTAGALASCFLSTAVRWALIQLGWHRSAQSWLIDHGVPWRVAVYAEMLYIRLPYILFDILGGAVVGFVAYKRWLRFSFFYVGAFLLVPWVWGMLDPRTKSIFAATPAWIHLWVFSQDLVIAALAISAAFLAFRVRHRRERRRAFGRCHQCDYDLTGNVTGVCPECGNAIPKAAE